MATMRLGLGVHDVLSLEAQSLGNADLGRRICGFEPRNHRGLPYPKHNLVGVSVGGIHSILLPL